jgi:predicted TIM-barrel fold metal-dependent hydrolase
MRNGLFLADAHTHIFSEPTRLYGRDVHFPVEDLIKGMDTNGVDAAVVITRPTSQLLIDELGALHDDVAASVAKFADRLVGFAWAAPRLGAAGVAEVRRCLKDLRFQGIKLHSGQELFNIDDPDVGPYLKLAREFDVPVTVHTQIAVRGAEPWRMVGPAQAYPDVQFIMAHLGGDGGMVQSLTAAHIAKQCDNIAVEVSTAVTDPWATYEGPAGILGPERVLIGSDAPLHQLELNLLKLDLLTVSTEWRRAFLGENLRRLVRLPAAVGRTSG